MSKFQKNIFSSIHKIWWHEWVWMKTCPPEVFWTPYHTHKPITRKNPLHFQGLVKKWRFLTNFFTSTKIFTCLVNKCWPKFFHDKKALIFPYTTLTSNFSYLLWSRKYFVLKIKYTRPPFSNNYLHLKLFIKTCSFSSRNRKNFVKMYGFTKLCHIFQILKTSSIFV